MTTKNYFLTMLFCLLLVGTVVAQSNSQYSVRFNYGDADCNTVYVDLEVKATAGAPAFNIAEQNYRFSFDDAVVSNPRITEELEISGTRISDDGQSFFDPHHLNGSLANIVSYNVVLAGGTGYRVDDTRWYPVGRIAFDIVDDSECFELKWHTKAPEDFPPTFVGEKFGGAAGILSSLNEGSYGEQAPSESLTCELCPKALDVTTPEIVENQFGIAEIFPNPVAGEELVTIKFNSLVTERTAIVISDELGRTVKSYNEAVVIGENQFSFEADFLASGIYFIQVKGSEGASNAQKLVKIGK